MKKTLAVLFTVAMAATTFAQGKDLAGTWNFDAAKTGPLKEEPAPKGEAAPAGSRRAGPGGPGKVVITQTDKTISIAMGSESNALVFNLDGSESNLAHDGKGKIAWKGDKLEATIITPRGPQTAAFYRQGAWLVMEAQGGERQKLYFAKAAAGK
jgi:hypothetical protein